VDGSDHCRSSMSTTTGRRSLRRTSQAMKPSMVLLRRPSPLRCTKTDSPGWPSCKSALKQGRRLTRHQPECADAGLESSQTRRHVILRANIECVFDRFDDRMKCRVLTGERTVALDPRVVDRGEINTYRPHQSRLADTRLAFDQHHPPVTAEHIVPTLTNHRVLFGSSDHRQQTARSAGIETRSSTTGSDHARHRNRISETLQIEVSERSEIEPTGNESLGGRGDASGSRLSYCFHSGGDVGGLADHECVLAAAGADRANRARPGVHPDAHLGSCPQRRDGLEDRQSGPHPLHCGIVVSFGVAEKHELAVAHQLGDESAKWSDRGIDRLVEAPHHVTKVFGIHSSGQRA
jgi:hypothetical protein